MIPAWLQLLIKILSVLLMSASLAAVLLQIRRQPRLRTDRPVKLGWLYIIIGILISRLLLVVLGLFVGEGSLENTWVHWDAQHYRTLMTNGYTADTSGDGWLYIVFFPLYPALCRLAGGTFLSMMAVSWACLLGAAVLIGRMTPSSDRFWAVLWLAVFPATVFLGAPYTESLFLLTTGLTLYMLRKRKWGTAGVFGMLAALTRNLGVLTALAFITEFLIAYGERVREGNAEWKHIFRSIATEGGLWCGLIPFGTLIYLMINQLVYGDPFIFMTIQKEHWSQSFGFFGQTMVTTIHYAAFYDEWIYRACLFIPQAVMMVISLITFPLLFRRMRASEAVYSFAYFLCILSPTWLLSYNRYLMGMVTLYPAMARAVRPVWARTLLTALMLLASVPLAIAYLKGWPVM